MKKKLILFFLLFPFAAMSATTWIGPSTITIAAWNIGTNWSSGVPAGSEQITFNTVVVLTENVPLTVNNGLVINNTITISSGISLTTGDVSLNGGAIINIGTFNAHNVTYTNPGESITNNNTMTLYNLNIGNSAKAGTFTNNSALSVTNNIVVEQGTFTANAGSATNTNGITVETGSSVINKGTVNSIGPTSADAIIINSGGTFTNQSSGVLNVNISQSNAYPIDSQGTLTNAGTINIGASPYNPGSKGVLVEKGSSFANTGKLVFAIDPASCVITDNSAPSGSFATTAITIISGKNCLGTLLPVKLISFSGQPSTGFNIIAWVAGDEQGLAKYELERSNADNAPVQWVTVSAFTPQSTYAYQYKDHTTQENSLYRLKAIDNDGQFVYSDIIGVNNNNAEKNLLSIYPVPATKMIHLSGHISGKGFAIAIINMSGIAIKQYAYTNNPASLELQYDIIDIPTGVYQLILMSSDGVVLERKRFVKTR